MYRLTIAPNARTTGTRADNFDTITSPTLTDLRDTLITHTRDNRIDISDRFTDQLYAVHPWNVADDEKTPRPRAVTETLILDLAGAVYGVSPGAFTITADES